MWFPPHRHSKMLNFPKSSYGSSKWSCDLIPYLPSSPSSTKFYIHTYISRITSAPHSFLRLFAMLSFSFWWAKVKAPWNTHPKSPTLWRNPQTFPWKILMIHHLLELSSLIQSFIFPLAVLVISLHFSLLLGWKMMNSLRRCHKLKNRPKLFQSFWFLSKEMISWTFSFHLHQTKFRIGAF